MNRIYLNNLFDIYQNLLNEHERQIFMDYYQDDLSITEIGENEQVTRTAIHKTIKSVEKKLITFEEKLSFYNKKEQIKQALENKKYDKILEILS